MNKRIKNEQLQNLKEQKAQLLDKIQRSKPILQTIYDKVKLKQKLLYDKIFREKKLVTQYKETAKQFKKLYEQSIQLMYKNKIADKFNNTNGNYIKTKATNNKTQYNKSKSVYQQYKQKINNNTRLHEEEQKNPEIDLLKRQNKILKEQMLNDIQRHKMVRDKSQRSLKKTKSSYLLKPSNYKRQLTQEAQYKNRVIEKQRQKLSRIK